MLTTQLELVLITFNRSAELRHTLTRLAESPFAGCRLTVLDNCSTDDTPDVCAALAPRFENFHVVRHHRNIGGGANTLRAVEIARAPYTWILCDDDELDFSACADVVEALEAAEVDLISLGAPGREHWPSGQTTLQTLADAGARVLWVFTFLPNTIFRTELFDDDARAEGYRLIGDLYPNFGFLRRQLERDAPVLVSGREIVKRGGLGVPVSELFWFLRWVRCCSTITEPQRRREAIDSADATRGQWLIRRAASIAQEKLAFPERARAEVGELLLLLRGGQRVRLLLLAPLVLVPRAAYAAVTAVIKRLELLVGAGKGGDPGAPAHALSARP